MRKLRQKQKRQIFVVAGVLAAVLVMGLLILIPDYTVLNPKGTIAHDQRNLLIFATVLSLVVIIPVFILTFYIVWKFREHKQARYTPDWESNNKLEAVWWGVPALIILVLSVVTWQSSHALDPYKPIESEKRPVTIQVIALPWKWLFIYPEQGIASVNYVQFPVDTPVHFQITSDAPMNSFWIPQLGGQVYAMTGMSTSLHLQASELGRYQGSSANLSGEGFAGMRFTAQATTKEEFELWAKTTNVTQASLTQDSYRDLATPTSEHPVKSYQLQDSQLYNKVIDHYMAHDAHKDDSNTSEEKHNPGTEHHE